MLQGIYLYSFLNDDAKVARPYMLAIYLHRFSELKLERSSPATIVWMSLTFGHLLIFPFPLLGFWAPSAI